ncbi:hypothetical protein CPB83DRAFT_843005 [Crepidotus variabilis]|uniref:Zn(2)-C6 fungal-type domain-containing protein n=1 Tax=Crepidotus variabilis TaxID=179855 RepID=A0A9P6JVT6_9AGAR|nr:hypothetical protein CPB83DRAFT_843005 [Crepidotus variabilis]
MRNTSISTSGAGPLDIYKRRSLNGHVITEPTSTQSKLVMSSSNVHTTKRRAQIACTNCRERKVKCEHENGETCKRCAASNKECHYEPVSTDKAPSSSPYPSTSMSHTSTLDGGFLVEGVRAPPSFPAQSSFSQMPVAAVHSQQASMPAQQYPTYPQTQTHTTQHPSPNHFHQYSQVSSLPSYSMPAQNPMAVPAPSQSWQTPQTQYGYGYAQSSTTQQIQPQNWPNIPQPNVGTQIAGYSYPMQPNSFNQQRPHEGGR